MQGEKIAEESGKVTSQRVMPNPDGGPKMETSFQASSTLLGAKATNRGTYWSVVRPSGTLYGEGQGIVIGEEGDMATWIGQGVGTMKKDGGVTYRGCRVLSDFVCQMGPAKQRGRDLRVRGGRPREQSLPVLGMEVGNPPALGS
jgi:hypothetical protein